MKKGADQFGLGSFEKATNSKKLGQQPTMKNNVPCPKPTRMNSPSASRSVKGIK